MSPVSPGGRQVARAAAPLITMGATWVVRKGMISVYESRTGKPAPLVGSRNGSIITRVAWAASVAAVIALVETLVMRALDEDEPVA